MFRDKATRFLRGLHPLGSLSRRVGDLLGGKGAWQPPPTPPRVSDESPAPSGLRIQPGTGDTPGPNHKEDIGRIWVSAQLFAGVPPLLVDLRDPASFGQGHLPAALLLPGRQILSRIEALASPGQDITLYDADGEGTSVELAAELRRRGFLRARRLVGGFAEWLREGEPIARPETVAGAAHQIGDAVRLLDGRSAVVQGLRVEGGTSLYTLLFDVYEDPLLDVEASSLEVG